jgi:PAS domain-containing protein
MGQPYQAVFDTIPLGIVIQDPAATIIAANPAAEKNIRLIPGPTAGRDSYDPGWRAIHADSAPFSEWRDFLG